MKKARLFCQLGLCGVVLVVAAAFFSACSRQVASLDERDFRDPLIRKAQSKIRQGDKDGAIDCLNKALARRPDLAQASLELALLYDDYKKDYVKAIYHYQRYLELRPTAQKRGLIEDRIRKAKMSFAASISEQYPETGKKLQALEEENSRLKASLREVRENLARYAKNKPAREAPSAVEALLPSVQPTQQVVTCAAKPLEPASTVYCVQAGDTLSLIAGKVYHNPRKWKVILDANRTNLVSPERLKSGQILTIPK